MIARRRDGRGRGGGDNTPTDNGNDDNDLDDNNNDNDDNNNNNGDGNNNNTTIKQYTGVRGRRKTMAAIDDGQQQTWQLLRRNSAWGIKEEEHMTIGNRQLHDG
jgi:hypothetical protein